MSFQGTWVDTFVGTSVDAFVGEISLSPTLRVANYRKSWIDYLSARRLLVSAFWGQRKKGSLRKLLQSFVRHLSGICRDLSEIVWHAPFSFGELNKDFLGYVGNLSHIYRKLSERFVDNFPRSPCRNHYRTDSGKGGFCNLLLELIPFRLNTVISPAARARIQFRQVISRKNTNVISELNSGSHLSGSTIILVQTKTRDFLCIILGTREMH